MSESQQIQFFDFNKVVMRCTIETHEMQRLKYLCSDPNCQLENKLGCADCFLENHPGHKKILIEQFVEKLIQKYSEVEAGVNRMNKESRLEEFQNIINKEIEDDMEELKQQLIQKVEYYKQDLVNLINKKSCTKNDFFDTYKEQFNQLQKIAQKKFEDLHESEISQCLGFYLDENVKKGLDDSEQQLGRIKQNLKNKKMKYIAKIKNTISDIINAIENKGESSDEGEDSGKNSQSALNKKKKRVSFAADVESPLKENINYNNVSGTTAGTEVQQLYRPFASEPRKFSAPRKKVKTESEFMNQ